MTPKKKPTASTPTRRKRGPRRVTETQAREVPQVSSRPGVDPQVAASLDRKRQPARQADPRGVMEARRQRIAEQAYSLFLQRGGEHGHALEDWLRAERLVAEQDREHG